MKTIDIGDIIKLLLKKSWIIMICAIIGGLLSYGYTHFTNTSTYEIVLDARLPQYNGAGTVNTVTELANQEVALRTFNKLGISPNTVRVNAQSQKNTTIIKIKLDSKDSSTLTEYANEYKNIFESISNDYINQSLKYELWKGNLTSGNPKTVKEFEQDLNVAVREVVLVGNIYEPKLLDTVMSKRFVFIGVFFGGLIGIIIAFINVVIRPR